MNRRQEHSKGNHTSKCENPSLDSTLLPPCVKQDRTFCLCESFTENIKQPQQGTADSPAFHVFSESIV